MSAHPDNARDAQRWADSFASRLNDKQALRATDWIGRIEQVDANFHARTL
jgi:CHASE1-domain containing sensor protein